MILCRFLQFPLGVSTFTEMLNCVTGFEFTDEEVLKIGKRIYTLERDFNAKAGFTREDDMLPSRFLTEKFSEGPSRNRVVKLDEMLDEYYSIRGWDSDGVPTRNTIEELDI